MPSKKIGVLRNEKAAGLRHSVNDFYLAVKCAVGMVSCGAQDAGAGQLLRIFQHRFHWI